MRPVVVERARIDDAATGESQPRLSLKVRNVLRLAEPQRMGAAICGGGLEDCFGVTHRDGAISDPAF
jgi:hypothetical protein